MIESDFSFNMAVWSLTGRDMTSINAFLEDTGKTGFWDNEIGKLNLSYLMEMREKAFFAYKAENIQLMEAHIEALFAWLTHLSHQRKAKPHVLQGLNFIKRQEDNAKKERNSIKVDNQKFSINHVIKRNLSKHKDELGDPIPAKDLWSDLVSLLDKMHLDPKESRKNKQPVSVSFFTDDAQTKRKHYRFSSFKSEISKARKK